MSNILFLPAEWHHQCGIQLTWPHENTDWEYILDEVEQCYLNLAREISSRQKLLIVAPDVADVRQKLQSFDMNMQNIVFFQCPTNDTWARDHGAITCMEGDKPVICDFKFNGWGLKFAANLDNLITSRLYEGAVFNGSYSNHLNFVMEGGGIESDGQGTLMTTSECMLSKNRNGEWNRQQIEQYLIRTFNLKRVLWVDHGYLSGDDTDSHIDTLARFCDRHTIAYVGCNDTSDEHYQALEAMAQQLRSFRTMEGKPYRLIELPMADPVYFDGERLPATYANFLIMNDAVLYPTYSQPAKDEAARQALAQAFPDREIVGVNCNALIKQHGSLHCVTMQLPDGTLK